jgi:hypothetical protein
MDYNRRGSIAVRRTVKSLSRATNPHCGDTSHYLRKRVIRVMSLCPTSIMHANIVTKLLSTRVCPGRDSQPTMYSTALSMEAEHRCQMIEMEHRSTLRYVEIIYPAEPSDARMYLA